jgi:hypothetical protein
MKKFRPLCHLRHRLRHPGKSRESNSADFANGKGQAKKNKIEGVAGKLTSADKAVKH